MKITEKQVDRDHYFSAAYNSPRRWTSFSQQYRLVRRNLQNGTVLEVGPGNGVVTHMLREAGYDVTTADIADDLDPDTVADVRDLPFDDNAFDAVCAFEVLEHIPFEDVETALQELRRVSSTYVFVSLPYARMTIEFSAKLPMLPQTQQVVSIPTYRLFDHEFDGEHYWEVGKKGYSKYRIDTLLSDYFRVNSCEENPYETYHLFYVLEVIQ